MNRKYYTLLIALVLSAILLLSLPGIAGAASTLYIDITATGSEITITCNATAWAVGTVSSTPPSDNISTAIDWAVLTNTTSEAVEITVHGNEMKDAATGLAKTWTLNSTGSPGAAAFAMHVGIDDTDDHWAIIIREHDDGTFAKLNNDGDESLAASDHWDFGLNFLAPTSSVGTEAMIMCDDTGSETNDSDNGVTLIATIAP